MNSEGFIATVFDEAYHNSFLEGNLTMEQLDMTICGATGFTGRLAAEYICEKYLKQTESNENDNNSDNSNNNNNNKHKYGLAGRSMNKLKALLNDLCKINPNAKNQFKLIECNAFKMDDCEKVARLSTVVITCV